MKNLLLIFILFLGVSFSANAQFGGQILDNLKRKTADKIDQVVDKVADKAEEKVTQKGKKKSDSQSKSSDESSESSTQNSSENEEQAAAENAPRANVSTVKTAEGTPFTNNKMLVTNLVFSESTYDFEPNPSTILNGIGATLQQKLKGEKLLIKIYQRTSGDDASKAEEEFMAIKMYLVNRFDLNEDRIYFVTPSTKKAGANRTIEFILVPDSFMYGDAVKY